MHQKVVVVEPLRIRLLDAQNLRELLQLVGISVLDDAEVKDVLAFLVSVRERRAYIVAPMSRAAFTNSG